MTGARASEENWDSLETCADGVHESVNVRKAAEACRMEIRITALAERHITALAEMEAECFSDPWSEQAYRDLLRHSYCHYLVAETDGRPVGFAGMTVSLDEGDIDKVMVAPDLRRMGIADRLLTELFALGTGVGVRDYTLEVRKSNQAAISLYEKLGFREEGIRSHFYTKPAEDALIMWKRA